MYAPQNTGVSEVPEQDLHDMLKRNPALLVVDIREESEVARCQFHLGGMQSSCPQAAWSVPCFRIHHSLLLLLAFAHSRSPNVKDDETWWLAYIASM